MAKSTKPLRIPIITELKDALRQISGLTGSLEKLDAAADDAQDAVEKIGEGSEEATREANKAFRKLGITSSAVFENQKREAEEAYQKIVQTYGKTSTEATRAYQAMQRKISRINRLMATDTEKAFAKSIKKINATLKTAGDGVRSAGGSVSAGVSAPAAIGLGAAIRAAANFEERMNGVRAVLNPTAKDFDELAKKAKHLGATTSFSATETAEAVEVLAANGLSAQAITAGALEASIHTAAATGGTLKDSADLMTDISAQFKIAAGDLPEIANQLTGLRTASKFSLEDIAFSFSQGGAVAAAAGVELEDFTAAIAAISPAFKSGSDAGTSFKTFMTALAKPSKDAAEIMAKIGFSAHDSQGKLLSMAEIAENLQNSLAGLSEKQRTASLAGIFGTDALRAASQLADAGAEGINKSLEAIGKGDAAKASATRLEGLNGELKKLRSAMEGFGIALAESGAVAFFTDLVVKATAFVSKLGEASPTTLKWITILAAGAAALGPLLLTLGQILLGARLIMMVFSAIAAVVGGIISIPVLIAAAIAAAVAALVVLVVKFRKEIGTFFTETIPGWITGMGEMLGGFFRSVVVHLFNSMKSAFAKIFDFVKKVVEYLTPFGLIIRGAKAAGVEIPGFKDGVVGLRGPGTGTSDSIPAWLSAGESVITARATQFWGPGFMHAINNMIMPPAMAPMAPALATPGAGRRVGVDLRGDNGQVFPVEADEKTAALLERHFNRKKATRATRLPRNMR